MTDLPEDTWAPVPMRWRLVRAGDVFLDRQGRPWVVMSTSERPGVISVSAAGALSTLARDMPPDSLIQVLVPLAERASIVLLREAGITTSVLDRTG